MRRFAIGLLTALLGMTLGVGAADAQGAANACSNCKYYTKVLQDFPQGVPHCEQCLKEAGDNPESRFLAGWCLAEVGRYSDAWAAFQPLVEQKDSKDKNVKENARNAEERISQYFSTHFNDGVKLLGEGDQKGARAAFEKATQIDPRQTKAWVNLGYTSKETGDLPGALTAYEKALAANPNELVTNQYYSIALMTKLESLKKATPPDTAAIAATCDQAMKALNVVVAADTTADVAIAYAQLGGLEMEKGDRENGIAHLKKAAELDPANAATLYYIGEDLIDAKQYAAAADVFQMTSEVVKDTSSDLWKGSMFNMALASYNSGDYAKAMETVEKLIAVHPTEKNYYELLQQAALKSGDTAKATEAAKKVDELVKAGAK